MIRHRTYRPAQKLWVLALSLVISLAFLNTATAQDEPESRNMYYSFQPDITTNYIKLQASRHLGYVRVGLEAVVDNIEDMGVVEHHDALLRDAFIEIFGQAQEGKIKSLVGREELRQACIDRARELLERETGRPVIRDLIVTTYLYQ